MTDTQLYAIPDFDTVVAARLSINLAPFELKPESRQAEQGGGGQRIACSITKNHNIQVIRMPDGRDSLFAVSECSCSREDAADAQNDRHICGEYYQTDAPAEFKIISDHAAMGPFRNNTVVNGIQLIPNAEDEIRTNLLVNTSDRQGRNTTSLVTCTQLQANDWRCDAPLELAEPPFYVLDREYDPAMSTFIDASGKAGRGRLGGSKEELGSIAEENIKIKHAADARFVPEEAWNIVVAPENAAALQTLQFGADENGQSKMVLLDNEQYTADAPLLNLYSSDFIHFIHPDCVVRIKRDNYGGDDFAACFEIVSPDGEKGGYVLSVFKNNSGKGWEVWAQMALEECQMFLESEKGNLPPVKLHKLD